MATTAAKGNNSLLKPIFKPLIEHLNMIRDQVTARKDHLSKAKFAEALETFPAIAQTYTSAALNIGKASQYEATKLRMDSQRIKKILEARKLKKLGYMVDKIATDLFGAIQKELILWSALNEVIRDLNSGDEKAVEKARNVIPAIKTKLKENFDAELTLIDQLTLMTRGGRAA